MVRLDRPHTPNKPQTPLPAQQVMRVVCAKSFASSGLPNDLVLSRGAASVAASNYLCSSRGAGGCSTLLASKLSPRLPNAGTSSHVEARHKKERVSLNAIEQSVGKSSQEGAPSVAVEHGEALGASGHGLDTCGNCIEELVTQTLALVLIPTVRIFDIRGGRRAKYRRNHRGRPRICARTSVHGMPAWSSFSSSSRRRSSSWR